jgi:alpha-beta hydrolase superfamily lysophospholipase
MSRPLRWRTWLRRVLRLSLLALLLLAAVLALRILSLERGPPLEAWHRTVPAELRAADLDRLSWDGYVDAEQRLIAAARRSVMQAAREGGPQPPDRYRLGSAVDPSGFAHDWNRSFVLEPAGAPVGVAVLAHGLTDAPYSMRHLAAHYQARGFVALGVRLPGHGTVPAALTATSWPDYVAAVRLAVREARRRVPAAAGPLHLVGYSTGGTAVLKYSLDALTDRTLAPAQQLVLLSPMVGLVDVARYAGVAGWPALLPRFAKAAWLDVLPEYNPFKYNSFPVEAARQSYASTQALQQQIEALAASGALAALPPVLTFQSVVDATVSAQDVVDALYARLPANGSELVLFDINRRPGVQQLLRPSTAAAIERLRAPPPRAYRLAWVGSDAGGATVRVAEAGATAEALQPLAIDYPPRVFSLSHVALPFPASDALYGLTPDLGEDFGVRLGTIDGHGERGTLMTSLDELQRMQSNPFFPYVTGRIDAAIAGPR